MKITSSLPPRLLEADDPDKSKPTYQCAARVLGGRMRRWKREIRQCGNRVPAPGMYCKRHAAEKAGQQQDPV